MHRLQTDILILGGGASGLFAALHAHQAAPELRITIAAKGLLGKSGGTPMVQSGFSAAFGAGDSAERHFMDTIEAGAWLPDQELTWLLANTAPERLQELENELGCRFDRKDDGAMHFKPVAGQSRDRTMHRGNATGVEVAARLTQQVFSRPVTRLDEHRAVALIASAEGTAVAGALMIKVRSGDYLFIQAKAVLLATGGGPTMYRYHTPGSDMSCDGMAMALRAGLPLRDMEMVQFHPTGLLAGPQTCATGAVIEEELLGAGGFILDGTGKRFLHRLDPRGERAARDIVARGIHAEIRIGRVSPRGGVYLQMSHLGPDTVRQHFAETVARCADWGLDLAAGRVEVAPSAHCLMGGVVIHPDCRTAMPGLFAAGGDSGGIHGANRLGGNGLAGSTVFGGIAGTAMARWVRNEGAWHAPDMGAMLTALSRCERPFTERPGDLEAIRSGLHELMWEEVGVIRSAAGLERAREELALMQEELEHTGVPDRQRAFNLTWHDWLNLHNLIAVSRVITEAALARKGSCGAHFRQDHPNQADPTASAFTVVRGGESGLTVSRQPVIFSRTRPGETLAGD